MNDNLKRPNAIDDELDTVCDGYLALCDYADVLESQNKRLCEVLPDA